jgi:protein-tyrosine-phosphatase
MKYVLFVCNAGRSQVAQAFFNRDAPAASAERLSLPDA